MTKWILAGTGALAFFAGCHHERHPEAAGAGEACPPEWSQAPAVEPSIAVPAGGGRVVLHAAASGTQNYTCARAGDGGAGFAWTFAGPEASLSDCRGASIGKHFASDAGPAAPEWQLAGGGHVVAHKLAASPAPGASGAVPWLLLAADGHGGDGPLSQARYVQRVGTRGGASPSGGCDASSAGTTQKVPYTGDYFFYAP